MSAHPIQSASGPSDIRELKIRFFKSILYKFHDERVDVLDRPIKTENAKLWDPLIEVRGNAIDFHIASCVVNDSSTGIFSTL